MRKLKLWLQIGLVGLVAILLRVWTLMSESPSFEEISASLTALRPFREYAADTQLDLCPPLYYLILHLLSWTGGSLALMRLPSAIAGAVTCVLVFLAARAIFSQRAGFLAGLLLAVSPLHIFSSQEAQPAALFTMVLVVAFYFLVRSLETGSVRTWLVYDVCAIALLYLHPKAMWVVGVLLVLHAAGVLWAQEPHGQRCVRRGRLLGMLLYNYAIIIALSLPWLLVMPTKLSYQEVQPGPLHLARAYLRYPLFGIVRKVPTYLFVAVGIALALLVPPLVNVLRRGNHRTLALFAAVVLIPAVPFVYSQFGRVRFSAARDAVLVAPLYAMLLGLLLGRCILPMRLFLIVLLFSGFGYSITRQAFKHQKLDWNRVRDVIEANAKANDLLVYWPDVTASVGRYYFGNKYDVLNATDFFERAGEAPREKPVYFVVTQIVPSSEPFVYTFPGALKHFASTDFLMQERLNLVARSTGLNMFQLGLWYDDPDSLRVEQDHATSNTQFIYHPNDPVFRNSQFHHDAPEVSYELSGRRGVWMAGPTVHLRLPVTLAPGNYALRVHCSPDFEQLEIGVSEKRSLKMRVWTGVEQTRATIDRETTVRLPFSTETEVKSLPVHIEAVPAAKLGHPRRNYGAKILSISIDLMSEQQGS